MLIVKAIQNKSEQETSCRLCGAEYDPDALCYGAWVDDALVGISQFRLGGDSKRGLGSISVLRNLPGSDDINALFIMGRQTMNFIDLAGVHECLLTDPEIDRDFAIRLGFSERDGELYADLEGFFDEPCAHGKAGSAK